MTASEPPNTRTPIICVTKSTWVGAGILNPNSWSGDSKGIVQSCLAEFSVLHHCVAQIEALCKDREKLCQPHIDTIQQQWHAAKFPIERSVVFSEQPDLHMRIEAFFSGVKSLLDLMVQLFTSERIVTVALHGFHRDQNVYGGSVIKALQNNVPKDRKELARRIGELVVEHKDKWINRVIHARDELVHPGRGEFQLMFQLDFAEKDGKLICTRVNPPTIESTSIDQYAARTFQQVAEFASAFIALLQGTDNNGGKTSAPAR